MKFLVLFPLFFGTAAAADWVLMDSLKMGSNYRDYEGRKVRGAKMKVYIENRMPTKHESCHHPRCRYWGTYDAYLLSDVTSKNGKRDHSVMSQFDLHCRENIFQVVKSTVYSGAMGTGDVVKESKPFKGWWVFGSRNGARHGFYSHLAEKMCATLSELDEKIPVKRGDHNH